MSLPTSFPIVEYNSGVFSNALIPLEKSPVACTTPPSPSIAPNKAGERPSLAPNAASPKKGSIVATPKAALSTASSNHQEEVPNFCHILPLVYCSPLYIGNSSPTLSCKVEEALYNQLSVINEIGLSNTF